MLYNKPWVAIYSLLLLLILPEVAYAVNKSYTPLHRPPENLVEAKEDSNNFLGFSFFTNQLPTGDKLKIIKYFGGGHILVYGNPTGDKKGSEYRFLGTNDKGEKISNIDFPNDAMPNGKLDEQKWIVQPWTSEELKKHLKNKGEIIKENIPFDGDSTFLPNITRGLQAKLPDEYRGSPRLEWHKIVHILQPPTYYGWGVGRAWHKKSDGSIWYRTIPIAPSMLVAAEESETNLQVTIAGYQGNPWPGQQITATAQVVNTLGKKITTDLVWKVNGQVIFTNPNFEITSTETSSAKFTMPSVDAKVEVMINPDKNRPPEETNWGDNSDSKTVKVQDDPGKKNYGDIFLELIAPAQVEPAKPWTYQVKVNYHWAQTYSRVLAAPAKDGKPAVYRDEPDDPPVVGLTLDVLGEGKHSDKYDPNLGVNYTSPVAQKDSKNFSLTGGTGQTLTFTFPGTALMNEGYYVLLKATLSNGATDSARVFVQPYAVDGLKTILKPFD